MARRLQSLVACPSLLNDFYRASHVCDDHNRRRQDLLGLEYAFSKELCPWFRIKICLIGDVVVDAVLAYMHFGNCRATAGRPGRKPPQKKLVAELIKQLINPEMSRNGPRPGSPLEVLGSLGNGVVTHALQIDVLPDVCHAARVGVEGTHGILS